MPDEFPLRYAAEVSDPPALACPVCGFECTHIDHVVVAARREDGPIVPIFVDGGTGDVHHNTRPEDVPAGPMGDGRRHRIALLGRCEQEHEFAIVFTQHKGYTFVDVVKGRQAPESE